MGASNAVFVMAMVTTLVSLGGTLVGAEVVHHVVGGDRGWDPSTDLASWSSGRIFNIGDKIWFTYSAAHGRIAELKTKEEYDSCDVNNPIKMYTDGIDSISLEREGIRYFASTNSESCRKGLKLHVEVPKQGPGAPKIYTTGESALGATVAAGPVPSGSANWAPSLVLLAAGLRLCYYYMVF